MSFFDRDPGKYKGPAESLVPRMSPFELCDGPNLRHPDDPLAAPFSGVFQLVIELTDGAWTSGSCFHIGGGRFVTAGHCLFFHDLQLMATQVGIVNATGDGTVTDVFQVPQEFVDNDYAESHDFGCIDVTDGAWPLPDFAFDLWSATNAELEDKENVHLCGFPAPYPGDVMVTTGSVRKGHVLLGAQRLRYTMDTLKGMSGGPCFTNVDGARLAVGIHVNGDCPNGAVRITADIRAWLNG
ncbi:serine protease [Reyranella sp. CPCC 100927]|uniref:trypsin-like serine peptidase n=1 Tax=Reyranella sp. CPCC 100927 TaxID=2599616 RepID=UPI0011B5DA28|nr:trypsin-like peptidase domain-containing protein [Reyranella sp. CPCC 100927]TWT06127.1 hypothetical protein FQU96_24085 [Reyranella sp. CPCC 100927]